MKMVHTVEATCFREEYKIDHDVSVNIYYGRYCGRVSCRIYRYIIAQLARFSHTLICTECAAILISTQSLLSCSSNTAMVSTRSTKRPLAEIDSNVPRRKSKLAKQTEKSKDDKKLSSKVVTYARMERDQLAQLCRDRNLHCGGGKIDLIE